MEHCWHISYKHSRNLERVVKEFSYCKNLMYSLYWALDLDKVMFDTSDSNAREEHENICQVVWHELKPVSLALLKSPLGARRGLLP